MPEQSGLSNLLKSLQAFQAECPTLPKDAVNPHFRSKFTPLDTVVETVRPLLAKHGLTWSALPCRDEEGPALQYMLGHGESGEVLVGTMPLLLDKSNSQGLGSAITYARRYSICAVLNLVADEDDDGNAASRRASQQRSTMDLEVQAREIYKDVSPEKLTAEDFEQLIADHKNDVDYMTRLVNRLKALRNPVPKPDTSYLEGK